MEDEVDQDENVEEEDEHEDDYPGTGGGAVDASGGVLLGLNRGVEVLDLFLVDYGVGVVLFGSVGVFLVVDERVYPWFSYKWGIHHTW